VLFLICDYRPATLTLQRARVSMSYAAALASVVLLGSAGAALIGTAALVTPQRAVAPVNRVFNAAQFAIGGYVAGRVFGGLTHGHTAWASGQIAGPFLAALVTFVAVNLGLIGGILLLSGQASAAELRHQIHELLVPVLGNGMLGLLIAGLWQSIGAAAGVLVLIPLFAARRAFAMAYAERQAYEAALAALGQAVETKDAYTRGHGERVSKGSVMIAEELGLRADRVDAIRQAGLVHDVGKMAVPTRILQKDGKPNEQEWAELQLHPRHGLEIIRDIGFLEEALGGIMHHHERLDGTGYPLGLAGDEIPEFARIIAVADTFDALTSDRAYHKAMPVADAVEVLHKVRGTQLDPAMVEAFVRGLRADT